MLWGGRSAQRSCIKSERGVVTGKAKNRMLAPGFSYATCLAAGQAEHTPSPAPAYLCGAINPRQKLSHVGVNPRVVGLGTALAPAHYTYQAPREFVLANQGAPAVPLQDSKDWSTTGM